jgi:glutamate carboxypeptidase
VREAYSSQLEWTTAQAPALRDELITLANLNSGSFNAAGVRAVAQRIAPRFGALGATAQWLELPAHRSTDDSGALRERAIAPAVRLRRRPDAPLQVFLGGHLDTVYAADHPFQTARFTDDDSLHGPGVADLKGGLLVMWLALATLERSPWRERIGWEVLLNPDEEIGSQGSAPLLAEAAQRNRFGLVYEPSFADGNLAGMRKGSGNFDILVHGRAAHAGRNPEQGRNAIVTAARVVAAVHALKRDGVTINPGYVRGGGALNVVPDFCLFKFNVRTQQIADEQWLRDALDAIFREQGGDGIVFELRGGFTRPPKPLNDAQQRLMDWTLDCGRELDLPLEFKPTGGCCDGNNLAAHGLPNLDNLGVVGRDIHSDRETMRWSSLAERARLSALLLMRVASGEWSWT